MKNNHLLKETSEDTVVLTDGKVKRQQLPCGYPSVSLETLANCYFFCFIFILSTDSFYKSTETLPVENNTCLQKDRHNDQQSSSKSSFWEAGRVQKSYYFPYISALASNKLDRDNAVIERA